MSWQQYVDTSLIGTGSVDKAAITDREGKAIWATSAGYDITDAERQEIVNAYSDPGTDGVKAVQTTGLHVAGERFVVIKADDRSMYGRLGREGICIVRTTQAMIIAHYPESLQPGQCADVVEKLGDYLIKLGY